MGAEPQRGNLRRVRCNGGEVRLLQDLVGANDAAIPDVWRARVRQTPEKTFLIRGHRRWSYAHAFEESRRFAGFLANRGWNGAGQRVASYLGNHAETLWAWFGTLFTGAAYFALNREHKGPLLADMITRGGAPLLVTEASAIDNLLALDTLPCRCALFVDEVPDAAAGLACEALSWHEAVSGCRPEELAAPGPGDLACILFTSGTTGRSKAVMLAHNAYCRGAARVAHAWGWQASDIFHAWLPLFHIAGQMHQTMGMVVAGGALAQFPTYSRSRFWAQVAECRATVVCGLANMLHLWDQAPPRPDDRHTTLRSVISAAIPPAIHRRLEERFGLRILEQYGMTEAELLTLPAHPDDAAPPGSCGRAGPDFDLAVVGPDDEPRPAGEVGEIVARPRIEGLLMLGYEGDAEATAEAMRGGWFHTGDFGYLDDSGWLFYVDRLAHVIRRRGENISSFELERVLSGFEPVLECAAVGVPSPLGEQDVKAVVSLGPDAAATEPEIHAWCRANMARFMVPRYIEIRGELPHNHVGKIDKKALKELPAGLWDAEAQPCST